ncbi:MAG: anhydro-N-acetylmuramic acid kinase [Phycisphaerae bacterium]
MWRLRKKRTLRVIGLMSGTSADGVDAAAVDVPDRGANVRLLAFRTYPYPPSVRRMVLDLCGPRAASVDDLCHANAVLGELFAEAAVRLAEEEGVPLRSVDLVGSHGQTVRHLPRGKRFRGRRIGSTLQIGDPCVIAERTGLPAVADFRPRDMAAGGQGAPLVPYADLLLFGHPRRSRVVCNIGGIANLTFLPAAGGPDDVLAFDTGPGNMVMDALVQRMTSGRHTFDRNGRLARSGRAHDGLLGELLRHPFLRRRPPRSTGREDFGPAFVDRLLERGEALGLAEADLVATAAAFTAGAVARACRRLPGRVDEVFLSGGGARNPALVGMLRDALDPAPVRVTDDLGLDADAKEAVSFAVLAAATIRGRANNLPSATGAARPVVLGKIVPGS